MITMTSGVDQSGVAAAAVEEIMFRSAVPILALQATQEPFSRENFAAVAWEWFDALSIAWKPSTVSSVRSILMGHLVPAFGSRRVMEITRSELLAYRARLIRTHAGRHGAAQLSPARANRVMTVLRQILAEAALQGGTASAGAAVTPLPERRQSIQPFTWPEVERLAAASPPHLADYVRVRCLTGLRSGEINGLRWDQVDRGRCVLRIIRARVAGREVLPKNEFSERDIPLTAPLVEALERQAARTGASAESFVFTTRRGAPISTTNFANRDWPAILTRAGLAPRRPYQTRHTAATLMLAAGENPAWIAQVLGHADCQMLWRTYARYLPNLTRQDGSAFAAAVARLAA